jgi:hypothetical protein
VSATYEDGQKAAFLNQSIASKAVLWWDTKDPEQAGLWQSTVTLSEAFFSEVVSHPIPVDMRALKALKKSPLALDAYCWLTYRASYAKRPSVIPWSVLALQFGSDYAELRFFKAGLPGRAAQGRHGVRRGSGRGHRRGSAGQAIPDAHQQEGRPP